MRLSRAETRRPFPKGKSRTLKGQGVGRAQSRASSWIGWKPEKKRFVSNPSPLVPSHPSSIPPSPRSFLIHGPLDLALKAKLSLALVGSFNPYCDDIRGIERWGRKVWEEPDLCCRNLTNGRTLFFFPSTQNAISALNTTFLPLCGAALSFSPRSQELGSFKAQIVWLRAFDIPLHAWTPETFRSIIGACGFLVFIHWKSVEFPPMGSIQLLVEVLNPSSIPSSLWLEVEGSFLAIRLTPLPPASSGAES
ncbi:hypothetical protein AMTRI_Chr04g248570 [Amborella trichopoda]